MAVIFSLIETAKANRADPYYYLKYLLEQMPIHLYDRGKESEFMPDMMPWSQRYRCFEAEEKENLVKAQAPPGNEKPHTSENGIRPPNLRKILHFNIHCALSDFLEVHFLHSNAETAGIFLYSVREVRIAFLCPLGDMVADLDTI